MPESYRSLALPGEIQVVTSAADDAFYPAGTGAVARTVESKLRDVVSVKDFGVVGDGIANDAVAFSAAIAASSGKVLEIPSDCTIGIGSLLTISTSNVIIKGFGAEIKQLVTFPIGGADPKLISLAASNVTIEGVAFISANPNTVDAIFSNTGLGTGLKFIDCSITGFKNGLWMYDASNVLVDGLSTYNCNGYHLWFQQNVSTISNTNITIRNCNLDNSAANPLTANNLCLLVRGSSDYPTTRVEVTSNEFIMPLNPTNTTVLGCELRFVVGATFSDNYSYGGSMLVSLAGCKDTVVDSNVAQLSNAYSIEVPGTTPFIADSIVISNNAIDGGQYPNANGIALQGQYQGGKVAIVGNTIRRCFGRSIYVDSQWDEVVIQANVILTTNASYGIYLNSAEKSFNISNNYLKGSGVGQKAIACFGSATEDLKEIIIANNVIDSWTENGVYFLVQSGRTLNGVLVVNNLFCNSNTGQAVGFSASGTRGDNIQIRNNLTHNNNPIIGNTAQGSILDAGNNLIDAWGTANPESLVTANIGSIYRRRGAADNPFYVKGSGTANTGWLRPIYSDANGVTYVADNVTKGARLVSPAGTTSTCTIAFPNVSSWRVATVTVKASTCENNGGNSGAAESVYNVKYLSSGTSLNVTTTDIVTSSGLSFSIAYGTGSATITATSLVSGNTIFWSVEVNAPGGKSTLTFA